MLIYKGYEQLTLIYDNVSGTSKNKLSQYGHRLFNVFSNIANCLWTGVIECMMIRLALGIYISSCLCRFCSLKVPNTNTNCGGIQALIVLDPETILQ